MKVSVRGWNRDMGETVIGQHSLLSVKYNEKGTVRRDTPSWYENYRRGVTVAWFQELKLTGNYRMEVEFSRDDIVKLFKVAFNGELRSFLIDEWKFTMSPELVREALKTIKLTDLTLGDLVAMNNASADEPATAERLVEPSNVTPFVRSV
jgi:hypothetical protein